MLEIESHPLLDAQWFVSRLPRELGELQSSSQLLTLLGVSAANQTEVTVPAEITDCRESHDIKPVVRRLLRHGGFKPAGRSKPASEYLQQAAEKGTLNSINLAVDICNVVSLHSRLPISVVDLDLTTPPHRIAVAQPGSQYVFNASGQSIDIAGLLCLFDQVGPCANAVKDSQRTKTHAGTKTTLTVIWGTSELPDYASLVREWYCRLLESNGVAVETGCD